MTLGQEVEGLLVEVGLSGLRMLRRCQLLGPSGMKDAVWDFGPGQKSAFGRGFDLWGSHLILHFIRLRRRLVVMLRRTTFDDALLQVLHPFGESVVVQGQTTQRDSTPIGKDFFRTHF